MKFEYDKLVDALYLRLTRGKVSKTVHLKDRLNVDVDKKGNVLGIEILGASTQIPKAQINKIQCFPGILSKTA